MLNINFDKQLAHMRLTIRINIYRRADLRIFLDVPG